MQAFIQISKFFCKFQIRKPKSLGGPDDIKKPDNQMIQELATFSCTIKISSPKDLILKREAFLLPSYFLKTFPSDLSSTNDRLITPLSQGGALYSDRRAIARPLVMNKKESRYFVWFRRGRKKKHGINTRALLSKIVFKILTKF